MTVENDKDVVTATGAGAILGVSAATVQRWAKQGHIPAVSRAHVGKQEWQFDRTAIETLAANRAQARQLLGSVPL
ncbi:MAG: helix-turn-helix domain-containing protein [Nocardiaceae bacterium]|nr:helix-turn-helix domain-containing protein [Nocardiaceae bacterium]